MENILTRRSVRKFDLEKKVGYDTLKKLCYAGFAAPTARRQESIGFVIIDDKEIIDKLSLISKGSIVLQNCNTAIAVIGDNPEKMTIPSMMIQDLSAATENVLLAARSMNLGTCWIGVTPISERMEAAAKILNMEEKTFVFSLIAVGFPVDDTVFFDAHKENNQKIWHNKVR